jgi:hypothetical protein
MNLWQQNYDPAGNIWLSSLIASLPILFFFFALIIRCLSFWHAHCIYIFEGGQQKK